MRQSLHSIRLFFAADKVLRLHRRRNACAIAQGPQVGAAITAGALKPTTPIGYPRSHLGHQSTGCKTCNEQPRRQRH